MKKIFLLSVIASLLFSGMLFASEKDTGHFNVNASKKYTSKSVENINNFNVVEVVGDIDVVYGISSNGTSTAKVYASDNIVDLVEFSVVDSKLIVNMRNNVIISGSPKLLVSLTSANLKQVIITGNGKLDVKKTPITDEQIVLTIVGGGHIGMKNISGSSLKSFINGSGDINIESMKFDSADISVSGNGYTAVKNIDCTDLKISTVMSGDIDINRAKFDELDANISGNGYIEIAKANGNSIKASAMDGDGTVTLAKGQIVSAHYDVNSMGTISARGVMAKYIDANVIDSGVLNCYATERLNSYVTGEGSVMHKGNPAVTNLDSKIIKSKYLR